MSKYGLVSLQQAVLLSCSLILASGTSCLAESGQNETAATAAPTADLNASPSASAPHSELQEKSGKVVAKPGIPISVNMASEDLQPTDNVQLAREQVAAYPDSPEAAFILAVALSRTSKVEEALKQVRVARRLADKQGGAEYFDKMIQSYEKMLEYYPDDNRVRYGLAWAYYMKAYLLAKYHPANPNVPAVSDASPAPLGALAAAPAAALPTTTTTTTTVTVPTTSPATTKPAPKNLESWVNAAAAGQVLSALSPQLAKNGTNIPGAVPLQNMPHIQGALELASPGAVPQIKHYYEAALKNLDDLLARTPDDVWARVYRAHLYAEFTGDLDQAMKQWNECKAQSPQNPAPYFFLGEGYLKQGNLKECLSNISRAIALRAVGN